MFALINLNIQRRFTSGHALALYENCYRFVRTGSTGWWPIELFRRLMGVDGSRYYESYKHLNAKVIKPAVAEVNRTSNIVVAPEVRRRGRAVSEIRFRIEENPQLAILNIDDGAGVRATPVYARLRDLGASDRLARQWISEHGAEAVTAQLAYVEGQGDVRSPVRYLSAALRDGYAKAGAAPATQAPATERGAHLARVKALAAARSPTQRDADRRLFLARLEGAARQDFEAHGWMSPLNAEAIIAFWRDLDPEAFAEA